MSGRPLRFLAIVVFGWIGLRVTLLWPTIATQDDIPRVVLPQLFASHSLPPVARPTRATFVATLPQARTFLPAGPLSSGAVWRVAIETRRKPDPDRIALAMLGLLSVGPSQPRDPSPPQAMAPPFPGALPGVASPASRWSASAWLVVRNGQGATSGLGGGQLGGGQAGLRLAYAIGASRRVSLVGRVTSPLVGQGREASLGVEWRPGKIPLRLVAERRFAMDGGKGGPAAGVIFGTGPAPIGSRFTLESYAQAGAIRRTRTELFADGAVRIARPIVSLGPAKVDLGLGGWGGAQPGAARFDIGPTLAARLPVGGKAIRVSLDWRQRVAGRARPTSGPALTIGSDF
ncbi:MAG: hypothetical protein V4459_00645 [Pseudomonadota bacterium]